MVILKEVNREKEDIFHLREATAREHRMGATDSLTYVCCAYLMPPDTCIGIYISRLYHSQTIPLCPKNNVKDWHVFNCHDCGWFRGIHRRKEVNTE